MPHADIADTLARHYRWNFHMATNWDSTDVLQAYLKRSRTPTIRTRIISTPSTRRIFPST